MNPEKTFCPNPDCPARGQIGKGNIHIHSQQEQRYKCTVCGRTFSAREGTVFYRCKIAEDIITLVIKLVAHGCPLEAIVAAFGFQARTVSRWIETSGSQCEEIHQEKVIQPRDLGQVQADEIRAKIQRGILWIAMAIMVSTRLWLGGVISPSRDKVLITSLVAMIRSCALSLPLLLCVDGLATYINAFRKAFRSAFKSSGVGRPRLIAWKELVIGQVVKKYERRRVAEVVHRLVQGTKEQLEILLVTTQGGGVLNTSYIERLNATFRSRLAALARRTRSLLRRQKMMHAGMYLVGTIYNLCTYHQSLSIDGVKRTPAMAANITDHCWSVEELLHYRVPPPPWKPPKRRGRRSNNLKMLIAQWAT